MTSLAFDRPAKRTVTFVEFGVGSRSQIAYLRVCDASSTQNALGFDYLPEPSMEVELEAQTGGLEDKPFRIRLPLARGLHASIDEFAKSMASPVPYPKVRVLVFEKVETEATAEQVITYLGEGEVLLSRRNPSGKPNIVELEVHPTKTLAKELKLGIPANPQCAWTFGGTGCTVDNTRYYTPGVDTYPPVGPYYQVRRFAVLLTMLGASRTQVVQLDSAFPGPIPTAAFTIRTAKWWVGGHVLDPVTGVTIRIRDWWYDSNLNSGTNKFVLARVPPKEWDSTLRPVGFPALVLVPGCRKTKDACDERQNLANFGGFGYGIPAYNPMQDIRT